MIVLRSRRLDYILNKVDHCDCAADVGCDHGHLSVALAQSGRAGHVIASDISMRSLEKASRLVSENCLAETVECVLSDGLAHLKEGHADVIIIAGMGGQTIADIISKNMSVAEKAELILCPHSNPDYLRSYLCKNGYEIKCDKVIEEESRFYPVLSVGYTGKENKLSREDAVLGQADSLVCDVDYRDFLIWFCNLQENLISEMSASSCKKTDDEKRDKKVLLDAARRRLQWQ